MDIERWTQLMCTLELDENSDTFSKLVEAHAQKHRRYHNAEHVDACLRHLDEVHECLNRPAEVEIAFWFHDAIYKPFSSTNELESAQWAEEFLLSQPVDDEVIARVHDLIMATCHTATDLEGDQAYMVDIDLSILGVAPEQYDQFEKAIRQEYKAVPRFIYRKKRKAILQSFLDRKSIYTTACFTERLEPSARENIERALATL